jgi:hypothetical protein
MTVLAEFFTIISALILLTGYLLIRKMPLRSIVLITFLSIPALYFSVDSMNSILTCDESYIVYEPVNLANDSLFNWNSGAFRTTDLSVGLPLFFLKKVTGFSLDIMAIFAKSLHWLIGFILILFLIDLIRRISDREKSFVSFFLMVFYSIVFLPVVLLAQKILNYDSLSMSGCVSAIFLLLTGWKEKKTSLLYLSVVLMAFAAQEKLIASPFLYVSICIVPFIVAFQNSDRSFSSLLRNGTLASCKAVLAAVSVFLFSYLVVALVNTKGMPQANPFDIFYPFASAFWPLLRMAGFSVFKLTKSTFAGYYLLVPMLVFLCAVLSTFVIALIYRMVCSREALYYSIQKRLAAVSLINYILFMLLFLAGIIGTYTVNAYLGPVHPLLPGELKGAEFNKTYIHFGAFSPVSHFFSSMGWAYAVFFNSIPSIFIVLAAFNLFFVSKQKIKPVLGLELFFTISLLVPLIYSTLKIPVSNRYFNVFILFVVLKMVVDFYRLSEFNFRTRVALAASVVFLLIEIFPFRPLYGPFRPLWSNYPSSYNSSFSKAVLNPSWMGWGEEVAMSGKKLLKYYKDSNPTLSGINIYHNYLGEWLLKNNDASLFIIDETSDLRYTENDFYIFNRMGVAQSFDELPSGVPAFDKISYRGLISAWIFRGSDLEKHNFRINTGMSHKGKE